MTFNPSPEPRLVVNEGILRAQAPRYHFSSVQDASDRTLRYSDERQGLYYSIFGEVPIRRSYYRGDGHGYFAMDAGLNIPPKGQSDFVRKMVEELERNLSAMRYDEYLKKGCLLPPASSKEVPHIVKDRCERSGMRWTVDGVDAFLRLRCIHQMVTGMLHAFRTRQRHLLVYGQEPSAERSAEVDEYSYVTSRDSGRPQFRLYCIAASWRTRSSTSEQT